MQDQPDSPGPDSHAHSPSPPPPPPPTPAPAAGTADNSMREECNMAVLAHLLGLTWFITVPGFIGPLILWLVKKDGQLYASSQIKESLNFQISIALYTILCGMLFFLVLPLLLIPVIAVLMVIFTIIAAVEARDGVDYRYPLTIRLIK